MIPPFFGGHKFFDFVAKQYQPGLVAIANGREGKHSRHFRHQIPFGLAKCAEQTTGTHVHQHIHRQFPFFFKYFAKVVPHPGSYVPIYKPWIITSIVFPHLFKRHSPSFESSVIFTRKQVIGQPFAFNLQFTNLFQYIGCGHAFLMLL